MLLSRKLPGRVFACSVNLLNQAGWGDLMNNPGQCPNCGVAIMPENARFCYECGTAISAHIAMPNTTFGSTLNRIDLDEKISRLFDLAEKVASRGHVRSLSGQFVQLGVFVIVGLITVILGLNIVLSSDSIAWLLGSVLGYWFGRGVGSFDFSRGQPKE